MINVVHPERSKTKVFQTEEEQIIAKIKNNLGQINVIASEMYTYSDE